MRPVKPGLTRPLADVGNPSAALAPSKSTEPAQVPEPQFKLPVPTQNAVREAFREHEVPHYAEVFLRAVPGILDPVDRIANQHQDRRMAFKALRADRASRTHLREAKQSLDAALGHITAMKHMPVVVADEFRVGIEAVERVRNLLEVVDRWLAKPQRRGPVRDLYVALALDGIAGFFQTHELPLVTTRDGLFAKVAARLLMTRDQEVSPRELQTAIRSAKRFSVSPPVSKIPLPEEPATERHGRLKTGRRRGPQTGLPPCHR